MKLFIKQRVFSFADTFVVKNDYDEEVYYVQGEFFSAGHKLHIYDVNHNEVGFVHENVFSFTPRFEIFIHGESKGYLVKKFSMFKPKFYLEGTDIEITGQFIDHDYEMKRNGIAVMEVYKEWLSWGDSYVLDIKNPDDDILALAIILAVDCEICSSNS